MIELERRFLVKKIPERLKESKFKEVADLYIPKTNMHPVIRIRKNGEKLEMTKKTPVNVGDSPKQEEQTIHLSKEEFEALAKLEGKEVKKIRYYYKQDNKIFEIDVFQGKLTGLILMDIEFENEVELKSFKMPDFCLAEVTQEVFLAGGMLCGKSYDDIEKELKKFNYNPLVL